VGIWLQTWPITSGLVVAVSRLTTPPIPPTVENSLKRMIAMKPYVVMASPAAIETWSEDPVALKALSYDGAPLNKRIGDALVAQGVVLCSIYAAMEVDAVSSNILNYQVVLADDLYEALKCGSINFAIVTRFDTATYPLPDVWGGSLIFDISKAPALLQSHIVFTATLASDPMELNVIALPREPVQQTYILWSPNIYLSESPTSVLRPAEVDARRAP
ncbi:hypothetical protein DFH07DRAFT_1010030, partial [Mycena maculata]